MADNGIETIPEVKAVEEVRWLNEGKQTPLWECIEDLAHRCEGMPNVQELLYRAVELAKGPQ